MFIKTCAREDVNSKSQICRYHYLLNTECQTENRFLFSHLKAIVPFYRAFVYAQKYLFIARYQIMKVNNVRFVLRNTLRQNA